MCFLLDERTERALSQTLKHTLKQTMSQEPANMVPSPHNLTPLSDGGNGVAHMALAQPSNLSPTGSSGGDRSLQSFSSPDALLKQMVRRAPMPTAEVPERLNASEVNVPPAE